MLLIFGFTPIVLAATEFKEYNNNSRLSDNRSLPYKKQIKLCSINMNIIIVDEVHGHCSWGTQKVYHPCFVRLDFPNIKPIFVVVVFVWFYVTM